MSLSQPEFAVRDVLETVVGMLLDDPRLVDDMLAERPEDERDSFRTALGVREGKVRLGWALEPPEDWLVTVVLAGTAPVQTLGDVASDLTEEPLAARELATDIDATEPLEVTFATGLPDVPDEVPPRGLVRIGDELAVYAIDIDAGTCTLERRGLQGTAAAPHDADTEVIFFERAQRIGYVEHVTLRIDVLGSNPPFLMTLARILQAFLMHARDHFEERGYTLETVTAGDLAPRAEAVQHLFARTITVRVLTAVSLPEILPPLTKINFTPTIETMGVSHASSF